MKPQPQTRPHPNGDCVRACIASLLELPITGVPDFTAMREDPDSELPVWYIEQQAFLKRHGFAFFEVQLEMKTLFPFPWPVWCIFIGPHRTSTPENEIRQAIVGMIDGAKLVPMFDPLGQPGEDPASAFANKKVVAVCFLVPTDPAKLLLRPEGVELFKPNGRQ